MDQPAPAPQLTQAGPAPQLTQAGPAPQLTQAGPTPQLTQAGLAPQSIPAAHMMQQPMNAVPQMAPPTFSQPQAMGGAFHQPLLGQPFAGPPSSSQPVSSLALYRPPSQYLQPQGFVQPGQVGSECGPAWGGAQAGTRSGWGLDRCPCGLG